jgi:two-component system cell cycle sensor histidine kinase/response regulator CckA
MHAPDQFPSPDASASDRVARAERSLRQVELERDRLFNLSIDLLSVANFDGWFEQVNPAWTTCLGWTAEELTSRPSIEFVHPDDREATLQKRAAIKMGQPLRGFDNRYLCKDGSFRWLSWNVHPLLESRQVFAVARDITDRRRLEQQVLRAQRIESIGTLAGGIAHDLNNVLAPILMSIDLLRLDLEAGDRADILDTMESSVRRGAEMVRHVLSFARGVEGARVAMHLDHLLPDVVATVRRTCGPHVDVRTSSAPDLWMLDGDPSQLHHVLLALCGNACDAMPDGGTLTLSAANTTLDRAAAPVDGARPGPYVVLTVEDTGTGMTPDVLSQIFDPFFTTREVGRGAGMGLSTALTIVRGHGGFIDVESTPGAGSRFRVFLPATPGSATEDDVATRSWPRGHGELVLVVDDEVSVRQLAGRTLAAFGYRVMLAADGAHGVTTYAEHRDEIALVLTDVRMPVMDGPSTIEALRTLNPHVRVIAASGYSEDARTSEVERAGAARVLAKPYSAEQLLGAVRDVLDAPPPE